MQPSYDHPPAVEQHKQHLSNPPCSASSPLRLNCPIYQTEKSAAVLSGLAVPRMPGSQRALQHSCRANAAPRCLSCSTALPYCSTALWAIGQCFREERGWRRERRHAHTVAGVLSGHRYCALRTHRCTHRECSFDLMLEGLAEGLMSDLHHNLILMRKIYAAFLLTLR